MELLAIHNEWVLYPLPHQEQLKKKAQAFWKETSQSIKEIPMNFVEAVEMVKQGHKITRKSWPEGMKVWWEDEMCIHSHPYSSSQEPIGEGYHYVMEKDDALASDWLVL